MEASATILFVIDAIAREAMLFAAIGFLIGGIDDLLVDLAYGAARLRDLLRRERSRLLAPEPLPMALLRPLSGSGAFAVMAETLKTHGPDSFVGMLVSTLQGSTETTFYVLTVYCGAAGVREMRHALPACLLGDLAGFVGATAACHLFFG